MEIKYLIDPERLKKQFAAYEESERMEIEAAIDDEPRISALDYNITRTSTDDLEAARVGLLIFKANFCMDVTGSTGKKTHYRCDICPFQIESGKCLLMNFISYDYPVYIGGKLTIESGEKE